MESYYPGIERWSESLFTKETGTEMIDKNIKEQDEIVEKLRYDKYAKESEIIKIESDKKRIMKLYNEMINAKETLMKFTDSKIINWDKQLDTNERFETFLLTTHYWEARWLESVNILLKNDGLNKNSQTRDKKEERFRRFAMLTPGMVSTLYALPSFFSYYSGTEVPLKNYIDLLFIDEAGQVPPEIGLVAFGLAKKAVVLGDIHQIQPIWSIPKTIDIGNLIKHKIIKSLGEFDKFQDTGRTSSSGSVMLVAKNACEVMLNEQKGVFLAQHTRCENEIIAICNELVYDMRIVACKESNSREGEFPPLKHCHIQGKSETVGTSRINIEEAKAIKCWLTKHEDRIIEVYGDGEKGIEDIVGIITPFKSQADKIKKTITQKGITVGTVHSFQGSEREIILFSTTYTHQDRSRRMLNDTPNLINVAVSRAKKSFIVFGDENILNFLNKDDLTPTSVLGRHLLSKK